MSITNKKIIKFKAVFIGKTDKFKHGVIYNLSIPESGSFKIKNIDNDDEVVYASLSAFLRNWSHIVHNNLK